MSTRVISLFTGIGGMDMGFEDDVIVHKDSITHLEFIKKDNTVEDFVELHNHGFDVVFQNDILEGAKEVHGYNKERPTDIYNTKSVYDLIKEDYVFPDADVIIGGFPCNDFSQCGKRGGFSSDTSHDLKSEINDNRDNSRGTLYKCFVEVVKQVKPKIFVAENVYGLLTMETNPIEQIIADFSACGYDVKYQVVYCPDFGIPQTRKRVIIMGRLHSLCVTDNDDDWNIITKNKAQCHIGKYFKHLQEPTETTDIAQQLYSKAKKLLKGQGQTEIDLKKFAPTMRAEHHGNIEFRRHENSKVNDTESHLPERRLTVREAGLIQTFPPEYVFMKKRTTAAYKYIGNAVPPLLSYLIADKVKELLNNDDQ